MTASPAVGTSPPTRPRADLRRLDRVVAAMLMPLGPAAVAILRFIIPGEPYGESVAAAPEAQRWVLGLGVIALLTLIPGAYSALHVVRRGAPRIAAAAGALLIPGYLGMTALGGVDAFAMAAHDAGVDPAETDRIAAVMMGLPTMTILLVVFVVGHILGTVLLGAAMIAARTNHVIVGIVMLVSQPLHLTAVIIESRPLDLVAWGMTAVAMAFLAWRVLRTPDAEWDLPPAGHDG